MCDEPRLASGFDAILFPNGYSYVLFSATPK
jgi:hypothetical protein